MMKPFVDPLFFQHWVYRGAIAVALAGAGSSVAFTSTAYDQASASSSSANSSADRDVLAAVIEDQVRPHVKQLAANAGIQESVVVVVLDRTVSMCAADRTPGAACLPPGVAEQFRTLLRIGDYQARALPGSYSTTTRNELVESFNQRGADSQPFPNLEVPGLLVTPEADMAAVLLAHERDTRGFAALSLPGYSSDGHALVYRYSTCGRSRCIDTSLSVLSRVLGRWQVELQFGQTVS